MIYDQRKSPQTTINLNQSEDFISLWSRNPEQLRSISSNTERWEHNQQHSWWNMIQTRINLILITAGIVDFYLFIFLSFFSGEP